MENYKISSDSGQGNNEWQTVWRNYNDISCDTGQGKTDLHVWWSTISVLTLDRIKMMAVSLENYNYITSDMGKKIKLTGIQYGRLQFQFWHKTR